MESLVLFAKPPILGRVKSRLAATLGDAAALKVYQALVSDSLYLMRQWVQEEKQTVGKRISVYFSAPPQHHDWELDGFEVQAQEGNDLGSRMANCFEREWALGAEKRLSRVGHPTLPPYFIKQAFSALDWHDLALGPAFDGGYWLVGAKEKTPPIFENMRWSVSTVMEETMHRLRGTSMDITLLPFWYDIDDIEDVRRAKWHAELIHKQSFDQAQHLFQIVAELPLDQR